jgi:2',3'-cyclic-nucleotide 2'-phosphodiesterase (5'-nucleotidase family)
MGYDAFAAGNHDFDYGLARLMDLANRYRLSFIAANITGREDGALILPPYVVRDFGGLKVGVFGLTTPETAYKTAPANVAAVDFGTPETLAATAREMTRMLREKEKADLVVALTHVGADPGGRPDSAFLARAAPGLDLVVDGHSHLAQPGLRVGRTLIVSAGAFLENVGRVEVRRGPRGRLELTSGLVSAAELENTTPDPAVAAEVARVAAELEPALKAVVARTPFFFNGDREEARRDSTNLGRLVCAAMMKYTGAEAALINSGSLRGSLPAGEVTLGQVLSALPFGNYALTVRLSGRDLRTILNSTLARPGRGAFPQFYGLTVTVREVPPLGSIPAGPRYRVEAVEIGGRPLVPEAEYLVAVNDFMLAGGDQYGIPAENNRGRIREFGSVEEMLRRFLAEDAPEDMVAIDRDDNLTIIAEEK